MDLQIPKDAFSDGQIRSKLWLSHSLNLWAQRYFQSHSNFWLTWYGSWVGVGPFMLLSLSDIQFETVNLVEIDKNSLETSENLLQHWFFKGVQIQKIFDDMNTFKPNPIPKNQIFVNTACEHVLSHQWLDNIPKGSFLILQSTNMKHEEHINSSQTLEEFKNKMANHITILETDQLDFKYSNYEFSRFMIFGRK